MGVAIHEKTEKQEKYRTTVRSIGKTLVYM